MGLTVLHVAYPFAPVGPDAVGGAEQVLAHLDAALVAAGHRSIVLSGSGGRAAGLLLHSGAPAAAVTPEVQRRAWVRHREKLLEALEAHAVDVVHMHGIDFHAYLPPAGRVPVLATLHLPPGWYPPEVFRLAAPGLQLQCVSRSQQRDCPGGAALAVIENGVPVAALRSRCRKRRFALVLARICPEKNVHVALDAARLARMPVMLGGQVFPHEAHQRYFRTEVLPRLDQERRFLGPLPFGRKRRLLSAARCVLLPSVAPETSSLVAMEALACGTPVVAFASGALPEIVEHGRTGFLVRDAREMAEAMHACDRIDPDRCRQAARERFSLEAMTARYFDAYRQLASRRA